MSDEQSNQQIERDPEYQMCPHCGYDGTEVTTTVSDHYYCGNGDCSVYRFHGGTSDQLLPASVSAAIGLSGEADELEAREDYDGDDHLQDVAQGLRMHESSLKEKLEEVGYHV